MKPVITLLLLFILFFHAATGANYYVNPSSDSTKANGTIKNPWKNLSAVNAAMHFFKAGDSIFFKKGELYFDKLEINCSGRLNVPIVFMAYGVAAEKPVFLFKAPASPEKEHIAIRILKSKYVVINGFDITDDRMDPSNRAAIANVTIAIAIYESNFIAVRNCGISLAGAGIDAEGNNNLIDRCTFQNLRMIRNTIEGNDDYGGSAIIIAGSGNLITRCMFKNCWTNSYDYTYAGCPVQFYGTRTNNNRLFYNTAVNCNGFLNFSSPAGGESINNIAGSNCILNCGEIVSVISKGIARLKVKNLVFFKNIILHSANNFLKPAAMFSLTGYTAAPGILKFSGNVFWITAKINIIGSTEFNEKEIIHTKNIYYFADGNPDFKEDNSELILTRKSPVFVDLQLINPDIYFFLYFQKNFLL